MELGSSRDTLSFWLVLSAIVLYSHCYAFSKINKEEVIKRLKELGKSGDTYLPDLLFFTKASLKNRSLDLLTSHTENTLPVFFDHPKRSRAEFTLSKAINQLRKDKNVWKITLLALLMEKIIDPKPPVAILPWWQGPERIYVTNIIKIFEGNMKGGSLREDVISLMKSADQQTEMVTSYRKSKNKDLKKRKSHIPHPQPKWIQPMSSEEVFRNWYSSGKKHRTKRSLSFSTSINVGDTECLEEGSGTNTHMYKPHLRRLCGVCVKDIDFGPKIIPRYAKSIECNDEEPSCLLGDGVCIQKMMMTTFQRLTKVNKDGSENWMAFQQPLNTSCECQCRSGSLIQTYFMP